MPYWTSSCGRIELEMTREQARSASQPGQDATDDVFALSRKPKIARQLEAIDPDTLRDELRGYGAWDDVQLADHDGNLQRVLWIAANDIREDKR